MSDEERGPTNANAPGIVVPEATKPLPSAPIDNEDSTRPDSGKWTDGNGKVRTYQVDHDGRKVRDWTTAEIETERRHWVSEGYDLARVRQVAGGDFGRYMDASEDHCDAVASGDRYLIDRADKARDKAESDVHTACGAPDVDKASPVAIARRYVRRYATHGDGESLRRWRGDWYAWHRSLGHYAELTQEQIDKILYRALKLEKQNIVDNVRDALKSIGDVLIDHAEMGTWLGEPPVTWDPLDLIACPNGIVYLPTGERREATPRYFATSALGVAYDPSAPSPSRWLAFLDQLWSDDSESIETLQEWFGLLLTPDTRQQKILLNVGPKRSGKGTIMRVLTALLTEAGIAAPTLASLGTNFGLWPLIGKSAAIIGDARLGGRSDVSQIVERLLSISGQDPQTIDRKHRSLWTGYLTPRFTINSNELPRVQDPSGALAGRLIVLRYRQSFFGREDTTLTDALIAELPGILLWAIEGWRRLRERGHLVQPASSADLIQDMEDLGSPVRAWIREQCEVAPDHSASTESLYRDYEMWCRRSGHNPSARETWARDLVTVVPDARRTRPRINGRQTQCYTGIRLAPSVVGPSLLDLPVSAE